MSDPTIPSLPDLPRLPTGDRDLLIWSRNIQLALAEMYRRLAARADFVVFDTTLATRPAADGTRRVWIDSTSKQASYDDGAWSSIVATAAAHHASHENGGADEIGVGGLSGLLADGQTPLAHKTSHETAGGDALTGALDANARIAVRVSSGAVAGTRRRINFIPGTGISIVAVDDGTDEEIDVTISLTP